MHFFVSDAIMLLWVKCFMMESLNQIKIGKFMMFGYGFIEVGYCHPRNDGFYQGLTPEKQYIKTKPCLHRDPLLFSVR